MKQIFPQTFLYFIIAIFILNLVQAGITELIFDEAYYWYYARELSWGYFDHPPMVAFLIAIGTVLSEGELGIRFMSCLLGIGTMMALWVIIDNPRKKEYIRHFFVLLLSMTLLHAYGFLMLPDTPLLFFTALFLLAYKRFLQNPGIQISIILGILMAALMYSKYHAFLVIILVFLSNLKLIRNKFAWGAVVVALLCYSPHFYWLYEHEFVSIKYHLFERPNRPYEFADFTLGYLLNLIAIFGLTFPWIYISLYKTRSADLFTKALKYISYGILVFFFISSFQRRVQTQWIIVICIPMALLAFQFLLKNEMARKWIFRMGLVNIAILLYLRIGLVFEPLFPVVYETHGNKNWVSQITSQIDSIPVVFENSYRMAPMYSYYSGNTSYSLNNVWYRENQYSIDKSEVNIYGKKVLYVSKYMAEGDIGFKMPDGTQFYGNYIDSFRSYRKLRTKITKVALLNPEDPSAFEVFNPYEFAIPPQELKFGLVLMDAYKQVLSVVPITPLSQKGTNNEYLNSKDRIGYQFSFPSVDMEGVAYLKIVISENGLRWGLNGEKIKRDEWNQ